MQTYETLLITSPNLPEEEEKATVDALAAVVTDGGGTMVYLDRMGRRRLAYPIAKFNDGIYQRFLYDSESDVPRELERRARLSDKILRTLTVRLEPEWAEDAKKQAVIDEQRKIEAAERAKVEAEERAKAEAEAAARAEAEGAAAPDTEGAPTTEAAPATDPAAASDAEQPPAEASAAPEPAAEAAPTPEDNPEKQADG